MGAWVRTISIRLARGSHGFYLHLRAGFDRLSRFLLSLKLSFAGGKVLARRSRHPGGLGRLLPNLPRNFPRSAWNAARSQSSMQNQTAAGSVIVPGGKKGNALETHRMSASDSDP